MFDIGDKIRFKKPDELEDYDNFSKGVKDLLAEFYGKVMTISSFDGSRYSFEECDLMGKEEGLILVSKRPSEPTMEEFESLF